MLPELSEIVTVHPLTGFAELFSPNGKDFDNFIVSGCI
jgi:hypothetical protein